MRFSTSIAYGPAFVIAILIFIDGIQHIVTRLSKVRNGVHELKILRFFRRLSRSKPSSNSVITNLPLGCVALAHIQAGIRQLVLLASRQ